MKPTSIACLLAAGLAASALYAGPAAAQEPPPAPGKPANLCQELLAFVKQPEPAKQAATTPQSQATAVSNPSGKTEGGKPADGGAPQKTSGLSGTVSESGPKSDAKAPEGKAPEGKPPEGKAPEAKSDAKSEAKPDPKTEPKSANPATDPRARANAEAKGPPAPGTPAPAPKPDQATIERIEAAASANDLGACRSAARSMRAAGVVMPPPLLSLSALDPKFFQP